MNNRTSHFIQLGLSILVMSSSGALGKIISLPVPVTIWSRCAISAVALFIFLRLSKNWVPVRSGPEFWWVVLSSVFMGLHWLTYFWALKLSNVAVGMLSLFTYPVMTAILEPIFTKKKFIIADILLAMAAFSGVLFLVPSFDLQNDVTFGILMGLLSAVLYSMRNILLKGSIVNYSGTVLMFYQVAIIGALLTPLMFMDSPASNLDTFQIEWEAILLLGLYTTALGHTMLVRSFKHFSITTISIITCLTPLFGILQGFIFLNEKPTEKVLIGGSIILASVLVESFRSVKKK